MGVSDQQGPAAAGNCGPAQRPGNLKEELAKKEVREDTGAVAAS